MEPTTYLSDLVARRLAERGVPGTVTIRPTVPLARRLETGERTRFLVDYHGHGDAHVVLDEFELTSGTRYASVVDVVADKIADRLVRNRREQRAA